MSSIVFIVFQLFTKYNDFLVFIIVYLSTSEKNNYFYSIFIFSLKKNSYTNVGHTAETIFNILQTLWFGHFFLFVICADNRGSQNFAREKSFIERQNRRTLKIPQSNKRRFCYVFPPKQSGKGRENSQRLNSTCLTRETTSIMTVNQNECFGMSIRESHKSYAILLPRINREKRRRYYNLYNTLTDSYHQKNIPEGYK